MKDLGGEYFLTKFFMLISWFIGALSCIEGWVLEDSVVNL